MKTIEAYCSTSINIRIYIGKVSNIIENLVLKSFSSSMVDVIALSNIIWWWEREGEGMIGLVSKTN